MTALLLLAAFLQDAEDFDRPLAELRWLARHQAEDGSWGVRPARCTCPAEPAPSSTIADPAKVRTWIAGLSSDDLATRDGTMQSLTLAGRSVVPALAAALPSAPNDEARERMRTVLRRLDYVERDVLEITSLAVSVLFRQEDADATLRPVRNRALAWLEQRKDDPATQGGVTLGQALAAEALAIAAADSQFEQRKRRAKSAHRALLARQNASGAWGPGRDDVFITMSVICAGTADDAVAGAAHERARAWLRQAARRGDRLAQAYGAMSPALGHTDEEREAYRAELARLEVDKVDPILRAAAGHALFVHLDGFKSPFKDRWREWLKQHAPLLRATERAPGCTQGSMSAPGSRAWATAWNAWESDILTRRW